MALARTSLRGFLRHAKQTLQTVQTREAPVTFVIGNESADLDSISSAIVYSYIESIFAQTGRPASLHIPIVNIPKADIALRPELLALLHKANFLEDHLTTLDDLGDIATIQDRLNPTNTRWILVDHNSFEGTLGKLYGSSVIGVVDHHADENKVPRETAPEPRIITTAGSCTSLVVNHLRPTWDAWMLTVAFSGAANGQGDNLIEDGAFATLWDAQVAQLALATILIDTACLKDKHKTTDHDVQAVEYLEAKVRMNPRIGKDYDRERLWRMVQEAKEDLGGLSIRDILRKDYKAWTEGETVLGTGAVVRPLSFLREKAKKAGGGDLIEHFRKFAVEQKIDLLAVLTAYTSEGEFRREMLLMATGEKGQQAMERFQSSSVKSFELQEEDTGESDGWRSVVWQQKNLAASRKQIAPKLREAMTTS